MFQFPINPVVGQQFVPAAGVTYQFNGTGWVLIDPALSALFPSGMIMPYAGFSAPPIGPLPFAGWLMCDGTVYSVAAFPALAAVVSNTFGGNGVTTFAVPDLRGRVIAGVDNMGGAFANRLTASTLGSPGTINAQGGAEAIPLSTADLPSHAHPITDTGHAHGVPDPGHAHGISDLGHAHSVSQSPHGHSAADLGHTHSLNGAATAIASGGFIAQTNNSSGDFANVGSGNANIAVSGANANVTIDNAGTGIGIFGAATGIVNTTGNATGISTTQAVGSGQSHLNVQPTMCLNYLIKA